MAAAPLTKHPPPPPTGATPICQLHGFCLHKHVLQLRINEIPAAICMSLKTAFSWKAPIGVTSDSFSDVNRMVLSLGWRKRKTNKISWILLVSLSLHPPFTMHGHKSLKVFSFRSVEARQQHNRSLKTKMLFCLNVPPTQFQLLSQPSFLPSSYISFFRSYSSLPRHSPFLCLVLLALWFQCSWVSV